MTTSRSSASLRYRERSSLTSDSETFFTRDFRTGRAMTLPPTDDCEHFHRIARDVVEHSNFADAEPILRPGQSAQAFDTALAQLLRLMPEMLLERLPHGRPERCLQ